ncbi:MAG TPA: FAD-dependent oxidoreductase, partial [Candidatus Angelobacter sp.]|nr:FAD-dependent oxidoreductase [Candidatus Angelobacter sp.]
MTAKPVVIVGGGGGGDAAAFALRKKGYDGGVTILSADHDRPYDRPYLSKEFLRGEVELPKVFLHDEADYSREKIEIRLQERVVGGSLRDRTLSLKSGTEVRFDTLVLSTGGTPRRLADAPDSYNVFTLRSLRDSQALRDAFKRAQRLLLVGAGFIGAEVAASARQLGKEVLMVESAPVP